jgi:hypothetical protein
MVVPSSLGRLFTYARISTLSPLENFTTEALAIAARAEATPWIDCLQQRGILAPGPVTLAEIETQVSIQGAGILDLVSLFEGNGVHEVWTEVKAFAPESGLQLTNYLAQIARHSSIRPVLMTLGPSPLSADPRILHATWRQLRMSVLRTAPESASWLDLVAFLEENHMADPFDEPITAGEAASIGSVRALLAKATRILTKAIDEVRPSWPFISWPADAVGIRSKIQGTLERTGSLFVAGATSTAVYPILGFVNSEGELAASVWLEVRGPNVQLRQQVVDIANNAGIGPEWSRSITTWGGLQVTERAVKLGDHDAIAAWFVERLQELERAGLLAFAAKPVTESNGLPGTTPNVTQ